MTETLVIGLDAATWRVIDPMIEDGNLPNIAGLIEDGTRGTLSSTVPPMTPLAWTSMATGVNPGKHGIFDFLNQDSETREISPVDFSEMDTPAIWDVFSHEEAGAGFVNFPLAHPPRQVDPFFIGGIPAHAKQKVAYPEEVQAYLDDIQYDVHPHVDPEVNPKEFYRAVKGVTETQAKATVELVERYDPDMLWAVFMGIDWIQHHFWDETIDGEDAVRAFYRYMDNVVGDLIEIVDDEGNVCLVSDHGAQRVKGVIHMNSLLDELGHLSQHESETRLAERVRTAVLDLMWSVGGRLPPTLKRLAKQRVPSSVQNKMRTAADQGQRGMAQQINWEQTEAFAYGYMGRVFLNSEERFDDGIVSDERATDFKENLASELAEVTHPETGETIFETVRTREEIYDGEHIGKAADLIAVPSEWEYSMFGDFAPEWIHSPESRSADHDSKGVVIISGPDMIAKNEIGDVTIDVTDVAPTLLYLAGLPVLDSMDGNVRKELLTADARAARTLEYIDEVGVFSPSNSTSSEEQQEVEKRLEDLGYM